MKKLYLIINRGCDASTYGIIELSEQELESMMRFIKDLNSNSYYACMPTISLREISWDDVREVVIRTDAKTYDDDYVDLGDRLFYKGMVYTWRNEDRLYDLECLPSIP